MNALTQPDGPRHGRTGGKRFIKSRTECFINKFGISHRFKRHFVNRKLWSFFTKPWFKKYAQTATMWLQDRVIMRGWRRDFMVQMSSRSAETYDSWLNTLCKLTALILQIQGQGDIHATCLTLCASTREVICGWSHPRWFVPCFPRQVLLFLRRRRDVSWFVRRCPLAARLLSRFVLLLPHQSSF